MSESLGTLIVTGGSRGIGAAVCRLAAARGYSVAVNFHFNSQAAAALVEEIARKGGRACAIQADVGRQADILRLFETAEMNLGPLTALVNNAGITGSFSRIDSVKADMLERLIAVNVVGAILCAREAVQRLSTKYGGRGGAIVNISSRAAQIGSPGEWVHYAMTKGATDTLTIGLARLIPTIPMGRPGTPEEIAEGRCLAAVSCRLLCHRRRASHGRRALTIRPHSH